MIFTDDQYLALASLNTWYRKYKSQFIDMAGIMGTGIWEVLQEFISVSPLDRREVIYLSKNQKQVLELAYRGYHAYYLEGIIYNYTRHVDMSTLPAINPRSKEIVVNWERSVRNKIDHRYKLMVVFDADLLTVRNIKDIGSFELPVIFIRDPMLLPSPDSYVFSRDPNIILRDINSEYAGNPIVYFAQQCILGKPLKYGNYDTVSVVPKKQLNLYNLKSSDMNITISEELRFEINKAYRERVMNLTSPINVVGERVIVTESLRSEQLKNTDNKKVRVYLTKGLVGYFTKVNKHAVGTRYVNVDLRPDGYADSFVDLSLDRFTLNKSSMDSQQAHPDEILKVDYAYALSSALSRYSHWDKVTLITEDDHIDDPELNTRLMYTAITRANKSLTIVN